MPRIASINDLKKNSGDDKGKGNEYYAGGAGRNGGSGVSVVGPNDGKVDSIVKKASEGKVEGLKVEKLLKSHSTRMPSRLMTVPYGCSTILQISL